jgi:hypothetical protein
LHWISRYHIEILSGLQSLYSLRLFWCHDDVGFLYCHRLSWNRPIII